jgi:hypothetical protein
MSVFRSPRTSFAFVLAVAAVLVLGFVPGTARAVVPGMPKKPVITNPSFDDVVNTMMYTVTVTVDGTGADADHEARVGFVPASEYTTCNRTTTWKWSRTQTFDTTATRSWTLYNFLPGTAYYYKVLIGTGTRSRSLCGMLSTPAAPTPKLPTNLSYLNIQYEWAGPFHPADTKYVILETDDCGASGMKLGGARDHLVVLDTVNETIVWYLDIAAMAGLRGGSGTGFRYQPGPTETSGRILLSVARRYLYEWGFDGSTINFYDFGTGGECEGDAGAMGPCLHHDAFKSDDSGLTYALSSKLSSVDAMGTEWEDSCGDTSLFIDDGWSVLDDTFTVTDEWSLMADHGYDPTVDGGPHAMALAARPMGCDSDIWNGTFDRTWGVIDWTHTNSITASHFGAIEVLDMSLKEWDQVLRFNANTGALQWRLSGRTADSDWDLVIAKGVTGSATFSDQHDAHAIAMNRLMMFDNRGDSAGSRVLEISLDTATDTATIEKSWAMVNAGGNPLTCGVEGSAEVVPGSTDHVLAMCAELRIFAELDDPTGNSGTPPPLVISLPNGTTDDFCTTGGPSERGMIRGWHRVFPMATVGEF